MRIKPSPPLRIPCNAHPRAYWERLPVFRRRSQRLPLPGEPGRFVVVESIWCVLDDWERMPESDDPAWKAETVGPYVEAVRVVGEGR